jgi:hypothetical protein
VPSRRRRTSSKQPPTGPRRQFMQIIVPFVLPGAWFASLVSLLRLDHPFAAFALSPLIVAGALAFGYCMRVAATKASAASRRTVPRLIYALAGLCFIGLTVLLAPLSYAYSHASGNAAISVTFGFLAFYCSMAGVLCFGRAVIRGPKRLAFWVFLPRWLRDSQPSRTRTSSTSGRGQRT